MMEPLRYPPEITDHYGKSVARLYRWFSEDRAKSRASQPAPLSTNHTNPTPRAPAIAGQWWHGSGEAGSPYTHERIGMKAGASGLMEWALLMMKQTY